jgi:integrase
VATITPYETASGKRYRVRYRTPDRRQTDRRGFRTKRDAQAFAASVEVSKMRGEYVAPADGRVTVDDVVDRWLTGRGDLGASTKERYAGIIRKHIAPRWTNIPIGYVRHSDVQAWSAKLTASGMAPASVRKTVRVLSLSLDLAVSDRLLAANPCAKVKIARPEVAPRRYLDHLQVRALARASGERSAVIFLLAYGGLRWGELAALRVSDVDLRKRRVTIERSVTEVAGKLAWTDGKSSKRRTVPIPRFVASELAVAITGKGAGDLVFAGERAGGVLRIRVARRSWFDRAVVTSGCPEGLHPHELRHTAASLAVSAGANVKAVQTMLGHASAAMTLDTYADLFSDDLDAVADRLDEVVGKMWAEASLTLT